MILLCYACLHFVIPEEPAKTSTLSSLHSSGLSAQKDGGTKLEVITLMKFVFMTAWTLECFAQPLKKKYLMGSAFSFFLKTDWSAVPEKKNQNIITHFS